MNNWLDGNGKSDGLEYRRRYRGLIGVNSKIPLRDRAVLSLVYTPGVAEACLAIQENPGSPATYRILAACYAHMGRLAEAREAATELRRITPLAMPSTLPWRMTEHRELLLSGLRLAGVEDG